MTYESNPVGVAIMTLVTILLGGLYVWAVRSTLRAARLENACGQCAYPIDPAILRCPECGSTQVHSDGVQRLTSVHKPLIAGLVLAFTVPGVVLVVIIALLTSGPTSMYIYGWRSLLGVPLIALIASLSSGIYLIARYRNLTRGGSES